MTDYTIMVDNVPFRVRGAASREQAQRAVEARFHDPDAKRQAILKRKAKLLEMGIDVDANFAVDETSRAERFLIGAGRTFTETGRGIQQLWYGARGDEGKVQALQRQESLHRDTFDMLDSQGTGMEDLGQLAPELVAFIGTGGSSSLTNLGLRSAALGGSKATVEGESRGVNAVVSGLLGAGSAGAARGVSAMFQRGAQLSGAAVQGIRNLVGRGANSPGGLANNMSSAMTQAQHLANSKDAALRRVGEESLAQLRTMIHGMNNVGKESLFRTQLNQLMTSSIRQVDNTLTLDTAAFVKGLEQVSRSQLTRELGRTFGPRIDNLRNVFIELGKHTDDLGGDAAQNILRQIMSNDSAAAIAAQVSRASTEGAKPGVMAGLLNTLQNTVQRTGNAAAASAGPETGDIVEDILREWDNKDIRIE